MYKNKRKLSPSPSQSSNLKIQKTNYSVKKIEGQPTVIKQEILKFLLERWYIIDCKKEYENIDYCNNVFDYGDDVDYSIKKEKYKLKFCRKIKYSYVKLKKDNRHLDTNPKKKHIDLTYDLIEDITNLKNVELKKEKYNDSRFFDNEKLINIYLETAKQNKTIIYQNENNDDEIVMFGFSNFIKNNPLNSLNLEKEQDKNDCIDDSEKTKIFVYNQSVRSNDGGIDYYINNYKDQNNLQNVFFNSNTPVFFHLNDALIKQIYNDLFDNTFTQNIVNGNGQSIMIDYKNKFISDLYNSTHMIIGYKINRKTMSWYYSNSSYHYPDPYELIDTKVEFVLFINKDSKFVPEINSSSTLGVKYIRKFFKENDIKYSFYCKPNEWSKMKIFPPAEIVKSRFYENESFQLFTNIEYPGTEYKHTIVNKLYKNIYDKLIEPVKAKILQ